MTLDKIHYNILLDKESFYVKEVEGESPQSHIETLEKINAIFQNHQRYSDSFEKTTPKELAEIAYTIQKYSFSPLEKEKVDDLCKKIEENMKNIIFRASEKVLEKRVDPFSLPSVMMNLVTEFLGVPNLRSLKSVNKTAKQHVENFSESFFKKVLLQLEDFCKKYPEASLTEKELEGIISFKTEQNKINDKEILKAINTQINIDHLLKYFSCEGIYDPSFEELKLFLLKRKAWNYQKEKLQTVLEGKLKELSNESSIILKKMIKVLIEKGADASGALRKAVETQNEFMSAALLECGVDINANYNFLDDDRYLHIRNLLMIAIEKGYQSMCKLLLDRGISIHAKGSQEMSALMIAAREGNQAICEFLLEKGANIEDKNEQGMTALMIAAREGNQAICELLLKKGANIEAVNKEGWTPLLYAVKYGQEQIVEFLLEKPYKANVNVQSLRWNQTSLMVVADNNEACEDEQSLSMSKLLLKYNPDLDIQDNFGETALTLAASNESSNLCKALIEKDADINIVNNNGSSALTEAIKTNNSELLNVLIGRKVEVNAVNKNKQTALMHAAKRKNLSLLEQLIKLKAEVDIADYRGNTALMYAIEEGSLACIKFLLDKNSKVDAQDINGETALMKAARCCTDPNIFEYLFYYGANLNLVSYREKQTALMYAAEQGKEKICRLLFNRYIDMNIQNFEGNTALMLAVKRGYQPVAEILLRSEKCDVNIQNFEGNTALMLAVKNKDISLCELLIKHGAKKEQSILDYLEKNATEAFRKLFYELGK